MTQGFLTFHIITHGHDGVPFTMSEQTHMCGNSVRQGTMAAFARANASWKYCRFSSPNSQEAA